MTPNYTPITNGDVYTEIIGMRAELRQALQEIAVVKARNLSADATHVDHETRLRRMEVDVIRIRVVASTIAAIVGIVSGYISSLIHYVH